MNLKNIIFLSQVPKEVNDWSNTTRILGQFFFLLIVFAIVLILAYYSTKWISKVKYIKGSALNMRIIEVLGVGFQNNIQLVKIGDKFVLIGVSKDKITYLTDVDREAIELSENDENIGFEQFLNNFMKTKRKSDSEEEK